MKRIYLFLGHYGSGKTNLAANWAIHLSNMGIPVSLADIDIVNPYFRTKDWEKEFQESGVELIALPYANTNLDLPSIPSEVYGLLQRRDRIAIFDIGGDDRGAYALGRFTPYIREENDYEMLFVVNFLRPLTRTAEEAYESMREIEAAAGIQFTGIVNNTNLGRESTAAHIEMGAEQSERLAALSGVPFIASTYDEQLRMLPGNRFFGTNGLIPIHVKRYME